MQEYDAITGIRAQNSVFEVLVGATQLIKMNAEITQLIDSNHDSVLSP